MRVWVYSSLIYGKNVFEFEIWTKERKVNRLFDIKEFLDKDLIKAIFDHRHNLEGFKLNMKVHYA